MAIEKTLKCLEALCRRRRPFIEPLWGDVHLVMFDFLQSLHYSRDVTHSSCIVKAFSPEVAKNSDESGLLYYKGNEFHSHQSQILKYSARGAGKLKRRRSFNDQFSKSLYVTSKSSVVTLFCSRVSNPSCAEILPKQGLRVLLLFPDCPLHQAVRER